MSEPSVWWPVPVESSQWFTEDQRRASRQYHDPIHRAAVLRAGGQAVCVLAVWWLVDRSRPDVSWWWVVAAVLAAVTLPRLAVDVWHEFIHEPRFGTEPVGVVAFVITTVGRLCIEGGLLALALAVLQEGDGAPWMTTLAACAAAAVPLVSALIGPRIVLLVHRATEVPPEHPAHHHVDALATAHQLASPRLVELDVASFAGANAYVTGQRSELTVAVSRRLLEGPDALLRHVVGHEITHLRHHHLLWSAIASSAFAWVTVAASLVITMLLSDGAARLPALVFIAAVVSQPFRLGLAWLSRANERQADRSAMRHAPISPELIKQLHLSDRPLLDPPRMERWHSSHPAPAERLESSARSLDGARTS